MTHFKYFILIFIFNCVSTEEDDIGINVGTVLFTESDDSKKCWSNEQLALLRSRFVFQDMLPDIRVITMENDRFVSTLLNYFHLAMQKVKTMTSGKTRQIHLMALTDAIGGYLHHIVIPLANHAYYMGNICFESAEKIKELYDDIKTYLRTDGQTWAAPITPDKFPKSPKRFKRAVPEESKDVCNNLVFTDHGSGNISFPTPFLDSKSNPTSIALPMKHYPLHNIRNSNSANILSRFYDSAMACLKEKKAPKENIDKFNKEFGAFIETDIMPHTKEELLYPAFGGVILLQDVIIHGGHPSAAPPGAEGSTPAAAYDESDYYGDEDKSTTIMFTAVAVVILIWIITGIIYCCCRLRRKPKGVTKPETKTAKNRESRSRSRSSAKSAKSEKPVEKRRSHVKDTCPKAICKQKQQEPSKSPPKSPPHSPGDKKAFKNPPLPNKKSPPPRTPSKTAQPFRTPSKTPPPPRTSSKTISNKTDSKKTDAKSPPEPTKPVKKSIVCRSCSKCSKEPCKKHRTEEPARKNPAWKSPPKTPPQTQHAHRSMQNASTTVGYAITGVPSVKGVKSAPVRLKTLKKRFSFVPEKLVTHSSTSTEKPIVFGYDFETTTSDSSSFDDTTTYSGGSTPKKI